MDKTYRAAQHPLLGEPHKMFEDDNLYVINERAEIGKSYTFICPQCHSHFIGQALTDEVQKLRCPDCDTYICFSTKGSEHVPSRMKTLAISENVQSTPPGTLIWTRESQLQSYTLEQGVTIIGRNDPNESSDIPLDDATASRRSVKIEVTKGEKTGRHIFRLTVLRTTNPVYVNYNALYSKSSIYLNYGDTIRIGETSFTLIAQK